MGESPRERPVRAGPDLRGAVAALRGYHAHDRGCRLRGYGWCAYKGRGDGVSYKVWGLGHRAIYDTHIRGVLNTRTGQSKSRWSRGHLLHGRIPNEEELARSQQLAEPRRVPLVQRARGRSPHVLLALEAAKEVEKRCGKKRWRGTA